MSHTHHISGYSNAATDYQDQLERMRAARAAKRAPEAGKRSRIKTFDSALEAYEEMEDQPQPRQEPDSDSGSAGRYA